MRLLVLAQLAAGTDDPLSFAKLAYEAIVNGSWWTAAAALLVALVFAIRKFGKWVHDLIPDDSKVWWHVALEVPLGFLFDTQPGAWLLTFLTALAGAVGSALVVGAPITLELLKPTLIITFTGSSLYELFRNAKAWTVSIKEWWAKRNAAPVSAVPPTNP